MAMSLVLYPAGAIGARSRDWLAEAAILITAVQFLTCLGAISLTLTLILIAAEGILTDAAIDGRQNQKNHDQTTRIHFVCESIRTAQFVIIAPTRGRVLTFDLEPFHLLRLVRIGLTDMPD